MAQARGDLPFNASTAGSAAGEAPRVRTITVQDVKDALKEGIDDFKAMPRHTIFLVLIYAMLCLLLIMATFNYDLVQLIFPFCAGFTLLGPVAAVGLYQLSRRREQGLDTNWWHMFSLGSAVSKGSIMLLGLGLLVVFLFWVSVAHTIFQATFGEGHVTPGQLMNELFTTGHGWALILIGNTVGAAFALAVFMITAVSFPMMVDRPVSISTAVRTSIDAVARNPRPMLAWAWIIAVALALGSLPIFIGLAVVLPVLGHATWHLYRKVVEI